MPEFDDLQSAFAAALLPRGDLAQALPLFRGEPARVARGLAIYRGNVQANAAKALAAIYPVAARIAGEQFFAGLAREYAARVPSVSSDLNEYGEGFGGFLAAFEPAWEIPYLPDVAKMEWRVHRAHYAADVPVLDPARLAQIDEADYPALRVALHPACALLVSEWPLARIWEVHQPEYSGDFDIGLHAGHPAPALVFRPELRVKVSPLSPGGHAFLASALAGATLGVALDTAMSEEPEFMLGAALMGWVSGRVVVDLRKPRLP